MIRWTTALLLAATLLAGTTACTGDGHGAEPAGRPSVLGTEALRAAPSGEPMPGRVRGWSRVFTDDFTTPVRRGSFPGTAYGKRWTVYEDGWKDTTGHGTYMPSKVLSVHDGVLDYWVRTVDGRHLVAAALPRMRPGAYGRYSVRFRAAPLHGYKTAWLLWPDSGRWPADGEIDWPEGDLDRTMTAYLHHARSGDSQERFPTAARYRAWHTATTVWKPGYVAFFLDGRRIGSSRTSVPDRPLHWVLQTETSTSGAVPAAATRGHVLVDWVVAYRPASTASTARAAGDVVLAAVGDINPASSSATDSAAGRVARSIRAAAPDAVAVLGDFQYTHGDCSSYVADFDRTGWGALMPKVIGTAGPTHDWSGTDDLAAYRQHLAGTCPGQRTGKSLADRATRTRVDPASHYWVDLGAWRVYSVSSGLWRYDTDRAEATTRWLRRALAKGRAAGDHAVVIWHEPYWTSDSEEHGPTTAVKPWVRVLDRYDVPLLLSGHQHGYERFLPQNADGTRNRRTGTQQFVVGTGGIGFYDWKDTARNSATHQARAYGWLRLVLHRDGHYSWRFVRTGGGAYSDSGSR